MKPLLLAALLALSSVLAHGQSPTAPAPGSQTVVLDDSALAQRLHQLTQELRCVVCQNESLADSTAPLAQDLKREIALRLQQGQSDAQITEFLVARYGDFVRYRPPWRAATLLLWLGPLLFLALALWVVRRHTRAGEPEPEEPTP